MFWRQHLFVMTAGLLALIGCGGYQSPTAPSVSNPVSSATPTGPVPQPPPPLPAPDENVIRAPGPRR